MPRTPVTRTLRSSRSSVHDSRVPESGQTTRRRSPRTDPDAKHTTWTVGKSVGEKGVLLTLTLESNDPAMIAAVEDAAQRNGVELVNELRGAVAEPAVP